MSLIAAQNAKERGNTAFKAGEYPEAIGFYTEALLADRSDPTYPLNRAAAYLKLGKFEDAEKDCSTVLHLKPGHAKGFFRRAQARIELGKYDDARKDLNEALKLEPSNDSIKIELTKLNTLVSNDTKLRKAPLDTSTSAPKRRRIPIEIVDTPRPPVTSSTSRPAPDNTFTTASSQAPSNVPSEPNSSSTSDPNKHSAVTSSDGSSSFKAAQKTRDTQRSNVAGGIFRPSGSHTVVRSPSPQKETQLNAIATHQVAPAPKSTATQLTGVKSSRPSLDGIKPTPSPMTLLDFTNRWLSQSSHEHRWNLWNRIPPSSLPTLFQSSLEASIFTSILEVLRDVLNSDQAENTAKIQSYLEWFTKVPRFSTLLLFLNSDERITAREVIHAAAMDGVWKV